MDPAWARALLAQCREAGVPFFMNQMSRHNERAAVNGGYGAGMSYLSVPIPDDLFVRQFPTPVTMKVIAASAPTSERDH